MPAVADAVVEFFRRPDAADPAPFYKFLRDNGPVVNGPGDLWMIGRYKDAERAARQLDCEWNRVSDGSRLGGVLDGHASPAQKLHSYGMAHQTRAAHDRIRGLVNKAFTPRSVARLEDRIEGIVNSLLEAAEPKGEMDAIANFTHPLPLTVISEMFGLAEDDHWRLAAMAQKMVSFLDITATPADRDAADAEAARFAEFILAEADKRRAEPRDDLLTRLVEAEDSGDRLSPEELVAACWVLTGAGHETTANLLGNLILILLQQRELWEEVCSSPSLVTAAVEEGLRFETPLRAVEPRWPVEDVVIDGVAIPAGQRVAVWVAAANRDPAVFEEPDTFSLHRESRMNLAFSVGPHYCLGASLARLEAQVAMRCLTERYPGLRLAIEQPQWKALVSLRALKELPVKW